MNETGDGPEAPPRALSGILHCRKQPDSLLELLPERDVTGAEAFVGQMGVEHCPQLLRRLVYGVKIGNEIRGLSGEAFGEILEQVRDLVPVSSESGVLDNPLDVEEAVAPYGVPGDCSGVVP